MAVCHLGTLGRFCGFFFVCLGFLKCVCVCKIHMNFHVFQLLDKSPYKAKKLLSTVRLLCFNRPYGEGLWWQQSELQMLLSGDA